MNKSLAKIFSIYFNPQPVYKNDLIEPIQAGCSINHFDLGLLRDDTGDHVSFKNKYYGELTVWYWVWKNYLPEHPDLQYIGFCHYRRFLNFANQTAFCHEEIPSWRFSRSFKKDRGYSTCDFTQTDLFLTSLSSPLYTSNELHYLDNHHNEPMFVMKDIMRELYPEYVQSMNETLSMNQAHYCLNFVLTRELFEELMTWSFTLLEEFEKRLPEASHESYYSVRTHAFFD